MRYIMGVDGGNSKTHTVIVDETGQTLGEGTAGCGNHQSAPESYLTNIKSSIQKALNQAGLKEQDIDFVQYGLAGADRLVDYEILRPALSMMDFQKWDLVCDTMEGLRVGSPDNIGVVLVCGSGTNAAGRNDEGQSVQTGGFGYLYGDGPGVGGHALAVEAFRASIRSWELRCAPTILEEMVPDFLGYGNAEVMFNRFLDRHENNIPADLSLVVHQAADKGDQMAIDLLQQVGKELGIAAVSVIRRLGGFEHKTIPIVMVGSVIQKGRNPYLLNAVKDTIAHHDLDHQLLIPEIAPVYGAVMLGMDHLGIQVSDEMSDTLLQQGGYQNEKS